MATPGDRREDHAQRSADRVAAEYGAAELAVIAATASLALKVANGTLSPQAAQRRLRHTVLLIMSGIVPKVQALIAALLAATLREALAEHASQPPGEAPEEQWYGRREWTPPFAQAPRQAAEWPTEPPDDTEPSRPPAQGHRPPFTPGRDTEPWEQELARLLDRATGHAVRTAEAEFVAVVRAVKRADAEPVNPYQAALDKAVERHGGWPGSTLSARRIRAAQDMLDDLADRGITGFTDKAGRRWDLATYAEMATRTVVSNAWDDMQAKAAARAGIDLAEVSTYSQEGSCPACLPWLGRTISLTGRAPGYPTLDEAKATGFRHPQCRCFWTPRGMRADITHPVSPVEAAAVYAASQKQRALERSVRAAGRASQAAVTPKARTAARRGLRAAREASAAHRKQHGLVMTKVGAQRRERPHGAR